MSFYILRLFGFENVVVYGQNCYGHDITQTYMMYDSLADVKREMKRKGIRNYSGMRKMS